MSGQSGNRIPCIAASEAEPARVAAPARVRGPLPRGLVIPFVRTDLPVLQEGPIDIDGIAQDDREHQQHPDQREDLALRHGGRVPGQSVAIEVLDVHDIVADTRMRLARPVVLAGKVERRRGVKHSQEVFAGTGITTATVEEYIDAGLDDARILRSFPTLYPADVALIRARRREPAPA